MDYIHNVVEYLDIGGLSYGFAILYSTFGLVMFIWMFLGPERLSLMEYVSRYCSILGDSEIKKNCGKEN